MYFKGLRNITLCLRPLSVTGLLISTFAHLLNLRPQPNHMEFLKDLGIRSHNAGSSTGTKWFDNPIQTIESFSPVDGKKIAAISLTTKENYDQIVDKAQQAWLVWRTWPAPKRGEVVRQVGEALREKKQRWHAQ